MCHFGRDSITWTHTKFVWNQVEPGVQDSGDKKCDLKTWRDFLQTWWLLKHLAAQIHVPDATPRSFPKVVLHFGRNSPWQQLRACCFFFSFEWCGDFCYAWASFRIHLKSCFGCVSVTGTNPVGLWCLVHLVVAQNYWPHWWLEF